MTEKSTSNSFEVHIVNINNIILLINFSANIETTRYFLICILLFC